jgi:hypothetical protein
MSVEAQEPQKSPEAAEARDDAMAGPVVACAVVTEGEGASVYPMFEVKRLDVDGAFLAGSLFLEVGEITTVELSWDEQTRIRVRVRVASLERGDEPGMSVVFPELDDGERKLIAERGVPGARS